MEERELVTLNEGGATRTERGTGRKSTPDVSLCSSGWENEWTWRVEERLNSDHWPIVMELRGGMVKEDRKRVVWNWKKADWGKFRELVKEGCLRLEDREEEKVSAMEERMRRIIVKGAREAIGKKVLRTKMGRF